MSNEEQLLKLIKENPGLPIIPMVDSEVVADDYYTYWRGTWGRSEVDEIYNGREYTHLRSDEDEEEVLTDIAGCKYNCTADGRDIYELSISEWEELYKSLPWEKAIIVYITT